MPSRPRKSLGTTRTRRAKKTFTLSRESVDFLETERKKRGRESTSVVLEELIRECRQKPDAQKTDAAISAYYDSLTDEDREENKHWGEFAEGQFPAD
jgi:hypothetical protein